jgi:hypothetical protein
MIKSGSISLKLNSGTNYINKITRFLIDTQEGFRGYILKKFSWSEDTAINKVMVVAVDIWTIRYYNNS